MPTETKRNWSIYVHAYMNSTESCVTYKRLESTMMKHMLPFEYIHCCQFSLSPISVTSIHSSIINDEQKNTLFAYTHTHTHTHTEKDDERNYRSTMWMPKKIHSIVASSLLLLQISMWMYPCTRVYPFLVGWVSVLTRIRHTHFCLEIYRL